MKPEKLTHNSNYLMRINPFPNPMVYLGKRHFVVCLMFKDLNCRLARPRLFKRWTALLTGRVTIQLIWIEIYPVDSTIHFLNNWGQMF